VPDASPGPRWRGLLSFACLAVGILCLIVGSLFVWMRVTAYNPDGYVSAALNVQGQVGVQNAVTKYVEDDLFDQQRAEDLALKVTETLPISSERKTFLAGVLATAVRSQVSTVVQDVLTSSAFRGVLEKATTRASEEIVALLKNEPGVFGFQGDAIVFDATPIVKEVRAELDTRLGNLAKLLPPPRAEGVRTYTVASGSNVVAVRNALTIMNLMSWLLPLLFVLLTIMGLLLARRRRTAAFRTAIAVAVTAVVVLVALRITKGIIAGLVSGPANENAVNAIINQVSSRLFSQTLFLALIAAIIGGALWLAGPDATAKKARGWITTRGHDIKAGTPSEAGVVTTFVRRYRPHLEVGGLAIAAIVLLSLPSVGVTTWILTLIALVVWYLAIEYTSAAPWMTSLARRGRDGDTGSTA